MEILESLPALRAFLNGRQTMSHKVGFVPTMGALHAGHLSLVQRAIEETDCCLVSIYVNPTQFNDAEDLKKYPSTLAEDLELLVQVGCAAVFLPDTPTMYPEGAQHTIKFGFGTLADTMEGNRKAHFSGVALVLSKLFNMIKPEVAYFGQKDYQQYLIVRRLVNVLCFDVKVRCCPTVRLPGGLALSSRNKRLSEEEKTDAQQLYAALKKVGEALSEGNTPTEAEAAGRQILNKTPNIKTEYLQIAHTDTLERLEKLPLPDKIFVGIAAKIGKVRLIDNVLLNKKNDQWVTYK